MRSIYTPALMSHANRQQIFKDARSRIT